MSLSPTYCCKEQIGQRTEFVTISVDNRTGQTLPEVTPNFTRNYTKLYQKLHQTLPEVTPNFTRSYTKLFCFKLCASRLKDQR